MDALHAMGWKVPHFNTVGMRAYWALSSPWVLQSPLPHCPFILVVLILPVTLHQHCHPGVTLPVQPFLVMLLFLVSCPSTWMRNFHPFLMLQDP